MNCPMLSININSIVYVRLTPAGRAQLRKKHEQLWAWVGGKSPYEYQEPVEDADGWSKWQWWRLMAEFGGPSMNMGMPLLFATEMRIAELGKERTRHDTAELARSDRL